MVLVDRKEVVMPQLNFSKAVCSVVCRACDEQVVVTVTLPYGKGPENEGDISPSACQWCGAELNWDDCMEAGKAEMQKEIDNINEERAIRKQMNRRVE
jgi:hypothetical protein